MICLELIFVYAARRGSSSFLCIGHLIVPTFNICEKSILSPVSRVGFNLHLLKGKCFWNSSEGFVLSPPFISVWAYGYAFYSLGYILRTYIEVLDAVSSVTAFFTLSQNCSGQTIQAWVHILAPGSSAVQSHLLKSWSLSLPRAEWGWWWHLEGRLFWSNGLMS